MPPRFTGTPVPRYRAGMKSLRVLLACLLIGAAARHASAAQSAVPVQSFKTGIITITTAASGAHRITVELATDNLQREQGLMYRPSLGRDAGMLFLYPTAQPVQMWMKNTLIPLDMLFIQGDGTIVNIHERAVPQSLETLGSAGMVRGVLELNGGTVARYGIKPGDHVTGEGLGP